MSQTDFHASPGASGAEAGQPCMQAGCAEAGRYRAPAAPGRLREYLWFCLEHVRAYNAGWNYHQGMSEAEIEADRRRAHTWDRPTWQLGRASQAWREAERKARDFSGFKNEDFRRRKSDSGGGETEARRGEAERALDELGLPPGSDLAAIRRRYRELAKRLHPDATGGDRRAEERLKRVTQAYATLKALHA